MFKPVLIACVAIAGALGLSGCDSTQTAVTAAICTDAATLKASTIALNAPETTALNGVISTCASTAGGTAFNNGTIALALINDAILLQSSGLLKDVHITAQVPADQKVLRHIKLDVARFGGSKVGISTGATHYAHVAGLNTP